MNLSRVTSHWVRARLVPPASSPWCRPAGEETVAAAIDPLVEISDQLAWNRSRALGPRPSLDITTSNSRQAPDRFATWGRTSRCSGRRAAGAPLSILAFRNRSGGALPSAPLSLFVAVDEARHQVATGHPEPKEPLLVWEYAGDGGPGGAPRPGIVLASPTGARS